jgi:hypothetical protein
MLENSGKRYSKGVLLQTQSRNIMAKCCNNISEDYKNFKRVTSVIYILNLHIATELKSGLFSVTDCVTVQHRTYKVYISKSDVG